MGALEQHNALRAKHENTPPMKLDSKMSKQAQEYAEEIARKQSLTHASASARTLDGEVCGENLAYAGGMFQSGEEEKAAIWASNAWYAEIVNYNWKTGEKNGKTEVARGQIGHFTQLVWDDSVKLGIGVAFNGSKVYVVARYLKHGNFRGQNLSHVHALKSGESPDPQPLKPETKSAVENGEDEKSEKKSKSKKKSRKSRKSKKSKKSKSKKSKSKKSKSKKSKKSKKSRKSKKSMKNLNVVQEVVLRMRNPSPKSLDQNQNPKNLGNRKNQRKMMIVVLRAVVMKNLNVVQEVVRQMRNQNRKMTILARAVIAVHQRVN